MPPAALDSLPLPLTPGQTPVPQHLGLFWAQGSPPPPAFPGQTLGLPAIPGCWLHATPHPEAAAVPRLPGAGGRVGILWGAPLAGSPDRDNLPILRHFSCQVQAWRVHQGIFVDKPASGWKCTLCPLR